MVSYQASLGALDNSAMGYGLCILFSPPVLLGFSAQGHPCMRTLSLACPGLGSWGAQHGTQPGAHRQADPQDIRGRFEGDGKLLEMSIAGPGGNSSCSCFTLREQVQDNLQTVTSQSYRPLEVPDGRTQLPWDSYQTSSGYSREKANSAPPAKEVRAGPGPGRSGEP